MSKKQCQAWVESTNSRCKKNALTVSKYCWAHQCKGNWGSLIVGLLSIIITIVMAIAANESNFEIAERSGAFEKPTIKAILGHHILKSNQPNRVIFGFDSVNKKNISVVGFLPLGVQNKGKKTIKNLTVTFRYHEMLNRDVLESLMELKTSGIYRPEGVEHNFSSEGKIHYSSFHIPRLDPEVAASINDIFFLSQTSVQDAIEYNGKLIPFRCEFAIKLNISITGEDLEIRDFPIEFEVVPAQSLNDLKLYLSKVRAPRDANELRQNTNFFEYLGLLLFKNTKKSVVLLYPNFTPVTAGDYTIYVPIENEYKISAATYDITKLNRLF